MKRFLFEDALKTDRDNVSGLDIANVNIEHLPKEVFEFKNLKGLFLKSTNIEEIPEDINKLENLELFSLYVTPPRSIDLLKVNAMLFQLSTLPRIKRINITANLMNWPSNLFLFHNLNILNLGSNQLREIPAEISCLSKLKEIDISSNKVSLISPSIGSLTRLKKVNLKGNLLNNIANLCTVPNLEEIEVGRNELLEILPDEIGNLSKLKSLILGDIFYWSNIKHIPDTINLLIKLEKLEAHRGDLKSLGLSFGELTNLKYLRMTHCNIHSLKFSFDKLNNLQKLILAANAIRELPASIGNAHSLKYLDISKNPIAHLPEQLSSLTNLEWLYIFETNITERETKKLNHFLPNTQITDPIAPYPDMTVEAQRAVLNYWFGDKRPPGFKWLDRIRK